MKNSRSGVITPVLLRPAGENHYEMISGHRRMYAARKAGLSTVPAIVRDMTDDEAVIAIVDANIQREELLPSEKAFAYKMKLNAMKRQAGRPLKNNVRQNGTNLRSDQELGEQVGESARSIQRYIRLTELIPELLDMIKARSAKIKLHKIQTRGGCVWNKKYHLIIFTARRPINTVFIEYRRRYFRMNILETFPVMRKSFMD